MNKTIVGGIAAVLLVAAAVAAWFLIIQDEDTPDDFTLELLAGDPQRYQRTILDDLECPIKRGDSPFLDVDHELGVTSVRSGYASEQVGAFTLAITAEASADELDLIVDHGESFGNGISCVFVDTSERSMIESTSGEGSSATWTQRDDTSGALNIEGIDAGEVIVLEMWAETIADPESASLPIQLGVSGAEGVAANTSVLGFSANLQTSGDAPEMNVSISGGRDTISAGERVNQRVTIDNSSTSAAASFAVLTGLVDNGGVIDSLDVIDTEGTRTTCELEAADYACDLGFVNPGESIVLEVTLGTDQASLPESKPRAPNSDCATTLSHICHEALFTQTGSFAPARAGDEKKVVITTANIFLASAQHDPETAYLNGNIFLEILLTVSDGQSRAEITEVTVEACNAGSARYDNGDEDGDLVMSPGEVHVYKCRADNVESASTFAVVNANVGPQAVAEIITLNLNVIRPHITSVAVPVVEGSAWDLINDGDQPIAEIALESSTEGCEPAVESGDDLTRDVLDVGETWHVTCVIENAQLRVFGVDPLGKSLGANE